MIRFFLPKQITPALAGTLKLFTNVIYSGSWHVVVRHFNPSLINDIGEKCSTLWVDSYTSTWITINIDYRYSLSQNILYLIQSSFTIKALALPSTLIRLLVLSTQLGILITFVYTFHFNYLCK